MVKRAIRNLHSDKPTQPRFCDVIIEGNKVFLEQKKNGKRNQTLYERIPWDDVVYQVEAAKQALSS